MDTYRPLVSVIIPAYNVEGYIGRCIDSLINQTLRDIEIIIVDDGSTDRTGEIADKYAKVESRIRVLHTTNSGVGMARNRGLVEASGEYVTFVDPDDYVVREAYDHLYKVGHGMQADIVIFTFTVINKKKNIFKDVQLKYTPNITLTPGEIRDEILARYVGDDLSASACNKLYKRSLIEAHLVRFDSAFQTSEDYLFNMHIFTYAERVIYVPIPFYKYDVSRANSATKIFRDNSYKTHETLYLKKMDLLKTWGLDVTYYRTLAAEHYVYKSLYDMMMVFSKGSPKGYLARYHLLSSIVSEPLLHNAIQLINPNNIHTEVHNGWWYSTKSLQYLRRKKTFMLFIMAVYYNSVVFKGLRFIKRYFDNFRKRGRVDL